MSNDITRAVGDQLFSLALDHGVEMLLGSDVADLLDVAETLFDLLADKRDDGDDTLAEHLQRLTDAITELQGLVDDEVDETFQNGDMP